MSITGTFPRMADKVPEGIVGSAKVEHFEVSKHDSEMTRIRSIRPGGRFDYVPPGRYARLLVHGGIMMSDTPMERFTNYEVVRRARGHVMIAGLGLGMILWPILAKEEVLSVDVLEKNPDVYDLVLPHVPNDPRLAVLEADCFTYKPERKYDAIYFDIWANVSTDTLVDMAKLHRKYAHHKAPGAWMNSWKKEMLVSERRSERRQPWW